MGVVSTVRNSLGSRLITADRKFEDQFEKAGVFMLKQEDFIIRHRYLQQLSDFLGNPFIEVNDKLNRVDRAMGEVGASFTAMGGDKVFQYMAKCWTRALIRWNYDFSAVRNAHSYYTVIVNIDEPRLELEKDIKEGQAQKWVEVFETVQEEVDADTFLHYYKTKDTSKVELVEVIPHGGIEEGLRRSLPVWKGSQDRKLFQNVGMEIAQRGKYCVWNSFKPEHVNPRSMIIMHVGNQQQQQGSGMIVPTSSLRKPQQSSAAGMQ